MRLESGLTRAITAIGVIAPVLLCAGTSLAETAIDRGAYLVTTIGACGNCHSPRNATQHVAAGMELSGGFTFDEDIGRIVGPNITPDKEVGIGNWTEVQIITALRDGKRPDGTIIGPPMPIAVYQKLSDDDAAAVADYLLSLKPIHLSVARTQYKIPLPPDYGPPVTHAEAPARSDKVAYGGYLATFGHCVLCHTAPGGGKPFDMSRAFAGGRELPEVANAGGVTVSRNITSDPEHGIGKWSDPQIKHAMTACIRPDGTQLSRTMPCDWYAKLTPGDLDAIVAFLRTVLPIKTP